MVLDLREAGLTRVEIGLIWYVEQTWNRMLLELLLNILGLMH
jgi:hypothetical protein